MVFFLCLKKGHLFKGEKEGKKDKMSIPRLPPLPPPHPQPTRTGPWLR